MTCGLSVFSRFAQPDTFLWRTLSLRAAISRVGCIVFFFACVLVESNMLLFSGCCCRNDVYPERHVSAIQSTVIVVRLRSRDVMELFYDACVGCIRPPTTNEAREGEFKIKATTPVCV